MTAVDNTGNVLYHFLRTLSVKVSRSTVQGLLDTPVGNSMRGISDALDALHVKNEVYQLPPTAEYFSQLEAPFITIRQVDRNPFCVVTKNAGSIVDFHDLEGEKRTMPIDKFLKHWSGNTLFAKVTPETPVEPFCFWKDGLFYVLKYKVIIVLLLLIALGLSSAFRHNASSVVIAYLCTLAFGILVSVAILYKELFNERFMERFCHIGKVVDCNEVIHSKGASIAGIGLGELSLLYFGVLFFFSTLCPANFYSITMICCALALCFTAYSIVYQIFIMHKICILCMIVNMTIWISTYFLYNMRTIITFKFTLHEICVFITIGCICIAIGLVVQELHMTIKERLILQQKTSMLFIPEIFQSLLSLETHIKKTIAKKSTLQSSADTSGRILIVTNPNCKNCVEIHQQMMALAKTTPISILLLTFPHDRSGEYAAQTIIATYQVDGWHKAMSLLEEWYRDKKFSEANKYPVTSEARRIWREQQEYCLQQGVDKTPATIVAGYYLPEIYSLAELKYVIT